MCLPHMAVAIWPPPLLLLPWETSRESLIWIILDHDFSLGLMKNSSQCIPLVKFHFDLCQIWIWGGLWKEKWSPKWSLDPKKIKKDSWRKLQGGARLDKEPKCRTLTTCWLAWMVFCGWKTRSSYVSWSVKLPSSIINYAHFTFRFADLGKRVTWRQEALDIKTALDMIKDSQKYLHDATEAEKASEAAAQSQRVKPKGNRSFSDLL